MPLYPNIWKKILKSYLSQHLKFISFLQRLSITSVTFEGFTIIKFREHVNPNICLGDRPTHVYVILTKLPRSFVPEDGT